MTTLQTMQETRSSRHISPLTLAMLFSMISCGLIFSLWPGLDLWVTSQFYDPATGFSGERSAFVIALYRGIPMMSKAIILGLFIAMFAYAFQRGAQGLKRRIQVGYLITALVLGPGLLIDVLLKDFWGRARPAKVAEFGGSAVFTPALVPAKQCDNNCSFVSGHASAGFYAVSLGFLGGAAARRRWTLIGFALGGIAGYGRIVQGGHFLSDVLFSFFATWFAAWFAWVIFRRLGWLTEPVTEKN